MNCTKILFERYRVEDKLGEGVVGGVHIKTGIPVAIKFVENKRGLNLNCMTSFLT